MSNYADKSSENRGNAIANQVLRKLSSEPVTKLADSQVETIAQRKSRSIKNLGPQVQQLNGNPEIAHNNRLLQKKVPEKELPVQAKFEPPFSLPQQPTILQRFSLPVINKAKAASPIQKFASPGQPAQKVENNTSLPENLNAGVESLSGFSMSNANIQSANNGIAISGVAQLMKFSRFQGFSKLVNWFQNSEEDELEAKEKKLEEFVDSMQPYKDTPAGAEISVIDSSLKEIKDSTVTAVNYATVLSRLNKLINRLNEISNRITKSVISYESNHQVASADMVQEDEGGPKSSELVYYINETYALLPGFYNTPDNKETIKEAILGELKDYKLSEKNITSNHIAFAKKRVSLLRKNLKKMSDRIITDWTAISASLNLTGKLKFIHLTGSDYHNDGQSVSIIESTDGQKAVYKPRSVVPDMRLEGAVDSFHSGLNDLGLGISTAKFVSKTDGKSGEQYGYMEFKQKQSVLSEEEAKNYYLKMGRMVVSTKLLGVTDLHQENILTSAGGDPIIIDAETSFLPEIMMADVWNATLITATLNSFEKNNKLTPNHFYTPAELIEWQSNVNNEGPTPNYAFIERKRQASYKQGGAYNADFIQGATEAINIVRNNKATIIKGITDMVAGITNIRIVPVETKELTGALTAYSKGATIAEKVLNALPGDVAGSLTNLGYVMQAGHTGVIRAGMKKDFDNTDIPIFHFTPATNAVTYHGVAIAIHRPGINVAIAANVDRISKTTIEEVMKSLNDA